MSFLVRLTGLELLTVSLLTMFFVTVQDCIIPISVGVAFMGEFSEMEHHNRSLFIALFITLLQLSSIVSRIVISLDSFIVVCAIRAFLVLG